MQRFRLKGASGKVANQFFVVAERTVIGSSPDCGLRLEEDGIAPRHAEISVESEGDLMIRQLNEAFEIHVNGKPVNQARLASGDEIRIANCRWVVQAPGMRPVKVLTAEATRPRRSLVPWLIVLFLLAAAALAWQLGWLPF